MSGVGKIEEYGFGKLGGISVADQEDAVIGIAVEAVKRFGAVHGNAVCRCLFTGGISLVVHQIEGKQALLVTGEFFRGKKIFKRKISSIFALPPACRECTGMLCSAWKSLERNSRKGSWFVSIPSVPLWEKGIWFARPCGSSRRTGGAKADRLCSLSAVIRKIYKLPIEIPG